MVRFFVMLKTPWQLVILSGEIGGHRCHAMSAMSMSMSTSVSRFSTMIIHKGMNFNPLKYVQKSLCMLDMHAKRILIHFRGVTYFRVIFTSRIYNKICSTFVPMTASKVDQTSFWTRDQKKTASQQSRKWIKIRISHTYSPRYMAIFT